MERAAPRCTNCTKGNEMKIHLEVKGPDLVVSITEETVINGPAGEGGQHIKQEVCSASLPLETIRQAMNSNARSRYKTTEQK